MARLTKSFWRTFARSGDYKRHASVSCRLAFTNYYSYRFVIDMIDDLLVKLEKHGAPVRAVSPVAAITVSFSNQLFGVFAATKILRSMRKVYFKRMVANKKNKPLQKEIFTNAIKIFHEQMRQKLEESKKATDSIKQQPSN